MGNCIHYRQITNTLTRLDEPKPSSNGWSVLNLKTLEIMTTSNLVLAIRWYVPDNWYGQNIRVILNGIDGTGFSNKTQAKEYVSKLKKFIKSVNRNYTGKGIVEVDLLENLETYRYCAYGPSWSCTNHIIDTEEFLEYLHK